MDTKKGPSALPNEEVNSIHVPKTKEKKELDRREKLKAELAAQSNSKWNSKKKKRLDKYIDNKLKKDERRLIFDKLSQSQAELPMTSLLQSSSTLGTGKVTTHHERLEKLEDKEVRRAFSSHSGKRKRHDVAFSGVIISEGDFSTDDDEKSPTVSRSTNSYINSSHTSVIQPESSSIPAIGSALQRNPDGSVVAPTIRRKYKGKKSVYKNWRDRGVATAHGPPGTSPEGEKSDIDYDHPDIEDISETHSSAEESSQQLKIPPNFKNWAKKQINIAQGHDIAHSMQPSIPKSTPSKKKRRVTDASNVMRGPLGEILELPTTVFADEMNKKSSAPTKISVTVNRPPDVEEARMRLPVVMEEQSIMEAILLHPVVVICGETGSGKTTQVPQFLYEAGFGTPGSDNPGIIGITQPRRVAAMSMAARVSHELSLTTSVVSYQIRYDATVSSNTSIKFMTDGVLLRELAADFLLTKYSVIVIDEAHERSINTDILIGVLSRVLNLREDLRKSRKEGARPLRLIIMSATLRVSDFAENKTLFSSPPPIINIAARQHPVTIHFNRRTSSDYVGEAMKKTVKIHTRLPAGGILIFLTGQNEITGVCNKLEAKFGRKALERKQAKNNIPSQIGRDNVGDSPHYEENRILTSAQADVEVEDLELGNSEPGDLAFDVDEATDDQDIEALDSDVEHDVELDEYAETEVPMHIVPLYALLPSDKQMRVFQTPPSGCRLVVVSTNVAETSITIPGIRYVVDAGRVKERQYDIANGVQTFQVNWISKASAAQRAGRAGRTGPGHCYRLYSSALFEHHFQQFSEPEIHRTPIEGVVLQMKSMHIDAVVNFPFPTPPDRSVLQKAERVLTYLGALNSDTSNKGTVLPDNAAASNQITDLGKSMSLFPLSPRFSRMLVSGQQQGCLPYIISIVSALSVGDPFLHDDGFWGAEDDEEATEAGGLNLSHLTSAAIKAKEIQRSRRKAFFNSQLTHSALGSSTSDMFKLLSVVGAYEYAGGGLKFCTDHFVRPKAMEEIHKLRAQVSNIVQMNFPGIDAGFVPKLPPPNNLQLKVLRQLLAAAFIDQVAVRKDCVERTPSVGVQYATCKGVAYRALGIIEDVFVHPSSVIANAPPPEYLVFHEVIRTTQIWMKGLTVVNPVWLSSLGKPSLCSFSKPSKNNAGVMMVIPRFGPDSWELPPIRVEAQV